MISLEDPRICSKVLYNKDLITACKLAGPYFVPKSNSVRLVCLPSSHDLVKRFLLFEKKFMRRGIGAASVLKQRERSQKLTELGERLEANRCEKAKEQLERFRDRLTEFALKYRSRIQEDPVFREQFVSMCDLVGVDPIQLSKESSSWLGRILGMGDFYSELSVQILTQCMLQRKSAYGSLLPASKCLDLIQTDNISLEDLRRAIKSLECFGAGGVRIVTIANEVFISSLPDELSGDSQSILQTFRSREGIALSQLCEQLGWPPQRTMRAIESLINEGVLWVDTCGGISTYWLLSLWLKSSGS